MSTITTRNNEHIKSKFDANVYHVRGLFLLGFGGGSYISHNNGLKAIFFTFSTSSLKQPAGGASCYVRRLPISRLHLIVHKNYSETPPTGILAEL